MQQAYDIAATYRENFQRGPQLEPLPAIPSNTVNERGEFLGFSVNSRLGIAAVGLQQLRTHRAGR